MCEREGWERERGVGWRRESVLRTPDLVSFQLSGSRQEPFIARKPMEYTQQKYVRLCVRECVRECLRERASERGRKRERMNF